MQRKIKVMGHREKLEARRKELLEQLAPLQNELSEIDVLLGYKKEPKSQGRNSASHRDYCFSETCLGQCMVR